MADAPIDFAAARAERLQDSAEWTVADEWAVVPNVAVPNVVKSVVPGVAVPSDPVPSDVAPKIHGHEKQPSLVTTEKCTASIDI